MRLLPAHYSDGVYQPVREPRHPNPRTLSRSLTSGPSGYHLTFEILDSRLPGCPPEFMNIDVPKGDPVFDPSGTGRVQLPFQRGPWDKDSSQSPNNPRIQVNLVTAWIDGSSIYGPSSSWSDTLRSFSGGLLASGAQWNMPRQGSGRIL
ncbi:hypothetical protein CRUP_034752, partial [Coryphaenoides rupestris]